MKKLQIALLSLFLSISTAWAGPYIELGIGTTLGPNTIENGCISDWTPQLKRYDCSSNPLGIAAIGYSYNGFSIHVEHTSSLQEQDYGLNTATIRYRYEFFND
jgi:hypothetical protein